MKEPTSPTDPATQAKPRQLVLGWREWLRFPDLGIDGINAKIDTGARTSALHAFDRKTFRRAGVLYASFTIQPEQRSDAKRQTIESEVIDRRAVKNTGGVADDRLVVSLNAEWNGVLWPIEVTLARRDHMGFRMLLGREAIRGRFLVDPGRSYLGGRRMKRAAESN